MSPQDEVDLLKSTIPEAWVGGPGMKPGETPGWVDYQKLTSRNRHYKPSHQRDTSLLMGVKRLFKKRASASGTNADPNDPGDPDEALW